MPNPTIAGVDDFAGTVSLVVIFVGGAVTWWRSIRDDRRASQDQKRADRGEEREDTTSDVNVVVKLTEGFASLQALQVKTWQDGQEAIREAAAARLEVTWLRTTVASLVRPLVAWIDSGAQPPPPAVPEELRRLLVDVEQHTPTPDP